MRQREMKNRGLRENGRKTEAEIERERGSAELGEGKS